MSRRKQDLERLFAEVCGWVQQHYHGRYARRLSIELDDGDQLQLPVPAPQSSATGLLEPPTVIFRHAPDFRSVRHRGTLYAFSPSQAQVVRVLWEAYLNGTPSVGQETLLEQAGCESRRLRDLFRDHPAWDRLIVSTDKRAFRLRLG